MQPSGHGIEDRRDAIHADHFHATELARQLYRGGDADTRMATPPTPLMVAPNVSEIGVARRQ